MGTKKDWGWGLRRLGCGDDAQLLSFRSPLWGEVAGGATLCSACAGRTSKLKFSADYIRGRRMKTDRALRVSYRKG